MTSISIGGVGDKGDAKGYSAYADAIRIRNLEFRNCLLDVVDKASVGDEEGLIGADVFRQFLIELDFPKRKLNLSQLPARPGEPLVRPSLATDDEPGSASDPNAVGNDAQGASPAPAPKYFDRFIGPEMKGYAGVLRFGHMLLVPTKINEVTGKLFLIDSGAFHNAITPDAAREVTKVQGTSEVIVKGLSGVVNKVYETGTVVLEFGGLRQKNIDMVAFDLSNISRSVGTEVSGMLGFPILNALTLKINYRDASVISVRACSSDAKRLCAILPITKSKTHEIPYTAMSAQMTTAIGPPMIAAITANTTQVACSDVCRDDFRRKPARRGGTGSWGGASRHEPCRATAVNIGQ